MAERGVLHELTAPSVELKNVFVAYAGHGNGLTVRHGTSAGYALENLSCQIERGEQVAIVGPNGAGKSTLLKVIVGTVKPSRGEVNVYGHGPQGHICIGYVPQRNQIDWSFPVTVEDVVMMGRVGQIGLFRWPRKRDWELVRESLQRVNALNLAKRQIGELSGGQQQRVFMARALAQEASLLLLDEPLTGLDVPSQEGILEILANLRPDGVTVMVATHDLGMAAARFDRVMLLNRQIVSFGAGTAVLQPEHLLKAYGGQMHLIPHGAEALLIADTSFEHGEAE